MIGHNYFGIEEEAASVRKRDVWGRFVKADDKLAVIDLPSKSFSGFHIEKPKKTPHVALSKAPYSDCCAIKIIYGFHASTHDRWIASTGVTREEHIAYNIKKTVDSIKLARYGLAMATINESQRIWGWEKGLLDAGFVLVSSVNNPQHHNQTRVHTYIKHLGTNSVFYDNAA